MEAEDISEDIQADRIDVVNGLIDEYVPPDSVEDMWDKEGLQSALERDFGLHFDVPEFLEEHDSVGERGLRDECVDRVEKAYQQKVEETGANIMRELEKGIMLRQLDALWKEHIAALDYLRQGINLRSFAQKNPKQEYKREAFEMFSDLIDRVKHDTLSILSKVQIRRPEDVQAVDERRQGASNLQFQHAEAPTLGAAMPEPPPGQPAPGNPAAGMRPLPQGLQAPGQAQPQAQPFVRDGRKVGRNEPCPCGSGKKFKQCHGSLS